MDMKKDKMQVRKRSSKMRNIFGGFNYNTYYNTFINSLSTNVIKIGNIITDTITNVDDSITYSVVPSRTKNDGVINNRRGIVVTYDRNNGGVTIEINRRYNCGGPFGFSACKYDVNLDSKNAREKVKFFNLSEFTNNGEDANFTIEFSEYKDIEKLDIYSSFEKYIYKVKNENGQIGKLTDILNKLSSNGSGQITKITNTTSTYVYNIIVPFRDFIFATSSIPFKPVMLKSQKLHHVLTLDADDRVFSFDVVDELRSEYRVSMIRPIEIFHDVSSSIPSKQWGGYISITIDMNWNITMKFVTSDGWNPKNQWIYGRLWFKSGDNEVESDANLSGESEYDVNFTNPNDNNRGYTDTVIRVHKLKAFRNLDLVFDPEKNVMDQKKIVIVEIKHNSYNNKMKLFKDSNNNDPHYIKEGDDEIYVLRYQGRIEGYYDGERQTFPSMSIDISGDIKVKLPGRFKSGNGYKFIGGNMWGYKSPNPFGPFIENAFFGYNHINKSYYNLDGQNNNMLYLNENDVVYERNLNSGMWYVALKNKIQIVRTLNSCINVILEIDENWNMTLVLYLLIEANASISPFKGYEWVYGKMMLETNISDSTDKFVNNIILQKQNRIIKIAQYTGDGIGIQRGMYYSVRPCGAGATGYCDNRILLRTSKTFNIKLLPVTTLNDFLRIDVTMLSYRDSQTAIGVLQSEPIIDYVDRIGIREHNVNIIGKYINYPTENFNINISYIVVINSEFTDTNNYDYDNKRYIDPYPDITNVTKEYWGGKSYYLNMNRDAILNISEALECRYVQEDGSFEVSIIRPINISYEVVYNYAYEFFSEKNTNRQWTVKLNILIDKNWNVYYTYTTPNDAWFQTENKGKNIQGEMRIFVNEVNNTNNNEVTLPSLAGKNGNTSRDADNYRFIGWADKKGLTKTIKYESNNTESNNKKKFRSLNNLIRFDANFASYYFKYDPDPLRKLGIIDTYMDKSYQFCDKLFNNTITLCCVEPIYFCYPENKSVPVDVLTVLDVRQENNVYFINVSDYVFAGNDNINITYEISGVADNATATLDDNAKLTVSKGTGSCILSAIQGNFKSSITLQWETKYNLYFCYLYPDNNLEEITGVLNLRITYPPIPIGSPFTYLYNYTNYGFDNVTYEISGEEDQLAKIKFSPPFILSFITEKGPGSCILTARRGYSKNSIKMKWDYNSFYFAYPENKFKEITDVLNISIPYEPYFLNLADYVFVSNKNAKLTYEITENANPNDVDISYGSTLFIRRRNRAGSCTLTVKQEETNLTISIKLQWNQLYFCYPDNKNDVLFDVLDVLNFTQENNVYFINVSDYVIGVNKDANITYEISDVADNATATLDDNAKLTLSKGTGSCTLTARQRSIGLQSSIRLQWDTEYKLYFCYRFPDNNFEQITGVLNLRIQYPPIKIGNPYTSLYNYTNYGGVGGDDITYEISGEEDQMAKIKFSPPYILRFIQKGPGSCILTARRGYFKTSITLKWDLCGGSDKDKVWCK